MCGVRAASGRLQLGDGDTVRLQAAQVSAADAGRRRGGGRQDVADRGRAVPDQDEAERGAGAQPHQVARPVHRLAAAGQRPQERQDQLSHARHLLGQLRQNQVLSLEHRAGPAPRARAAPVALQPAHATRTASCSCCDNGKGKESDTLRTIMVNKDVYITGACIVCMPYGITRTYRPLGRGSISRPYRPQPLLRPVLSICPLGLNKDERLCRAVPCRAQTRTFVSHL